LDFRPVRININRHDPSIIVGLLQDGWQLGMWWNQLKSASVGYGFHI